MASHRGSSSDGTDVIDLADRPDAAELLYQLYKEILVPSFRQEELDPYEKLAAGLSGNPRTTDIAVARGDSGQSLGAMVGEWFPLHRVYLLSYLAVLPGRRSGGIGSRLMWRLGEYASERHSLVTLAEVDDPRRHPTDVLIGDPGARLAFYGRFGARVVDLPYFQPRLMPDGPRAHGMLLLALHVDEDALEEGPVGALRSDLLVGFIRTYFAECEGTAGKPDPELGSLIDRASSRAGIPLLPVAHYPEVVPAEG